MYVKDLIFVVWVCITALPVIMTGAISGTMFLTLMSTYFILLIGLNVWSTMKSGMWLMAKFPKQ